MTILRTLLSHWRRNPVQLAAMVVGLALATALWSGVQAINAEAKASYARSNALIGGERVAALLSRDGGRFAQDAFVRLRRAGVEVSPVVEGRIPATDRLIRVVGIEPLSIPLEAAPPGMQEVDGDGLPAFLAPPWEGIVAPETLPQLEGRDGLPPLRADPGMPPDTMIVDIGVAQRLLEAGGEIDRLLLAPGEAVPPALLDDLDLRERRPDARGDAGELTDSFHLNLTAFAFLAFVVGLFIVHAAIGLATEQRLGMFRTLRACGISAKRLTLVLAGEVIAIAVLSGLIGVVLGYVIAAALLPDVAGSLRGLYGVAVPGRLSLPWSWWLSGIGMSVLGAAVAAALALATAYRLPPLASARPEAWRQAQEGRLRLCAIAAAVLLAVAVLGLLLWESLAAGFLVMAAVLLGAALALPVLLDAILGWGARRATGPVAQWAWADMRQQLSGLSLALMALLLALSANIGVGTMVEGFRETFLGWLDKRLAAEVYVRPADDAEEARLMAWAEADPRITDALPTRMAEIEIDGVAVQVLGVTDGPTYRETWPLLSGGPGSWEAVFAGEGVLVSEQAGRRLGVLEGGTVPIRGRDLPVVGSYADYGNPKGQVLVALPVLLEARPNAERQGTGLRLDPAETEAVIADLRSEFAIPEDRLIDQAAVKGLAREIFERTFAVTSALNVLTLGVAGVALFASLLTLSDRRLPQVAPLWAMGLTRGRLARVELWKTLGLAALTALVAIPLGLVLAWLLVAVINVHAFGWRLPLFLFPAQWATLAGLSLVIAAVAAALPLLKLRRTPPARLLGVFAEAR